MAFKICQKCNEKNPARCRKCKKCESAFAFKVKKKNGEKKLKIDWKSLQKGDTIKVSGGGPFFLKKGTLEEVSMGYSGLFSVCAVDENGIQAIGIDKFSGFCHIWMNGEGVSSTGVNKRPHSVYKVEKRVD